MEIKVGEKFLFKIEREGLNIEDKDFQTKSNAQKNVFSEEKNELLRKKICGIQNI